MVSTELAGLMKHVETKEETYKPEKDRDLKTVGAFQAFTNVREPVFNKGQSRRIWGELYKVIDASDVVIQVLDARDPEGTRSKHIEEYMKKEKSFKQLIFVLNKCDLTPNWVTAGWVATLSKICPTLAFHASVTNSYGKGALIQLLRQFGQLHSDKQQISVGFIGYPNVGKSSIINTLKGSKVTKTAPIPGETKVWQYVTLMRRIYLVDCPGVVYPSGDSESDVVLKGVVRVEKIQTPEDYIEAVLKRARPEYICRQYGIDINELQTKDHVAFLENLAKRLGRLNKGGEPDIRTVAIMVLHDWQQGKIPYYHPPPQREKPETKDEAELTEEEAKAKARNAALEVQALEQVAEIPEPEGFFNADDLEDPREKEAAEGEQDSGEADEDGDDDDAGPSWDDLTSPNDAAEAAEVEAEAEPEPTPAVASGSKKDRKRRRVEEAVDTEAGAEKAVSKKKKKKTAKKAEKAPAAAAAEGGASAPDAGPAPAKVAKSVPEFVRSKKFVGSKPGYAFYAGKKGLGYYVDHKPIVGGKKKKNKKTKQVVPDGDAADAPVAKASEDKPAKKKSTKARTFDDHPALIKLKKQKREQAKQARAAKKQAELDAEEPEGKGSGKYNRQAKEEPRMTTLKGKKAGDHYYSEVNIKNRRRGKAPQQPK